MKAFLIGLQILMLILSAHESTGIIYKTILPPDENESKKTEIPSKISPDNTNQTLPPPHLIDYDIISARNLFDVQIREPDPDQPASAEETRQETIEQSDLKLALWGTVIANSPSGSYAVIENQATREQVLYQTGDTLVGAVLKQILRNKVILTKDGQTQYLEINDTKCLAVPASASLPLPELDPVPRTLSSFPLDEMAAESAPDTLADLMKQVRIRPFFSNGKPSGLLLYGIENNSIFQSAGFKNGDIIQTINGNQISRAGDALAFYQELAAEAGLQTIQVTILRQGAPMEIIL